MNPQLFLSAADATPMYRQIVDQITAKVLAGDWPAGAALPSIRELAAASGVSVITVKRAYQELEHAGVIVTRAARGSFVAESQLQPAQLLRLALARQLDAALATARTLGWSQAQLHQALTERAADFEEGSAP